MNSESKVTRANAKKGIADLLAIPTSLVEIGLPCQPRRHEMTLICPVARLQFYVEW